MPGSRLIQVGAFAGLSWLVLGFNAPAYAQLRRPAGMGRSRPERVPKQPKLPQQHTAPLEQFEKMSPEAREKELAKLPSDRKEKLQRQLQRYDRLSPAQKEQLDWFNHLSPDRQETFRKAFQKFQNEPAERQQVLKEELGRLTSLSEEDRNSRLASEEFRNRYSGNERQILSEMSGLLPAK